MKLTVLIPPVLADMIRIAAEKREEALTVWVREAIRQRLEREATRG